MTRTRIAKSLIVIVVTAMIAVNVIEIAKDEIEATNVAGEVAEKENERKMLMAMKL